MKETGNTMHKVIVKTMTVNRCMNDVFDFFEDVKRSMEAGGVVKSVTKSNNGWWVFDHVVAGKAKMKHMAVRQVGVLDHIFIGAGIKWHVYVRIVPNQDSSSSTVVWIFTRPDGLTDERFEKQLEGFDYEIALWKKVLEQST